MSKNALLAKTFTANALAAAVLASALVGVASAPVEAAYVQAGVLTCNVAPSVGLIVTERRDMTCVFTAGGRSENYTGILRKLGLAVGVTGAGVIVWGVLSSSNAPPARGAIAGEYAGASADASIIVGAGANVLVGGSNKAFALQPVSVQGQIGLNFAVGISDLVLTASP